MFAFVQPRVVGTNPKPGVKKKPKNFVLLKMELVAKKNLSACSVFSTLEGAPNYKAHVETKESEIIPSVYLQ